MSKPITEATLRKLYDEVEPLFPEATLLTTPGMSGNDRVFSGDGFRIGLSCVLINEKKPELLDVGLWCNYPNYHMLPSKEGITIQEAKDWLIRSAKFDIEQEKVAKIERSRRRRNLALIAIAFAMFVAYIAIKNGPVNFMLLIKMVVFFVGSPLIGLMISMVFMWLLHVVTGIEIKNQSSEILVDGVWKGEHEELGVAKVRHRITNFSIASGMIIASLCLYVGLFTKYLLSIDGVYLFITLDVL